MKFATLPEGFNKACHEHNKNMLKKGFWDDMKYVETDTDFNQELYNNAIATRLALIMSEVGEAVEAMRKDKYGLREKDTFEDELADTLLRLMDLIGFMGIDIETQLAWKSELNASRPYKHGKEF